MTLTDLQVVELQRAVAAQKLATEKQAAALVQAKIDKKVAEELKKVLAGDIPDSIQVDLATVEIGDTISISSVSLPEGAKPTIDRDFVIASISAPRTMSADDEDEADEVPTTGDDAEE